MKNYFLTHLFIGLYTLLPGSQTLAQIPTITALSPTRNQRDAPVNTNVAVTFDQSINNSAASKGALRVFSQQRGGAMGDGLGGVTTVANGNALRFNPTNNFKPGETVFVTSTTAVKSDAGGNLAHGHVYQFTTATGGMGTGDFRLIGRTGAGTTTTRITLGDVDGDGDLDAVATNNDDFVVTVHRNAGDGFLNFGEDVSVAAYCSAAVLGDIDSDGDLDIVAVSPNTGQISIRLNGGDASGSNTGTFSGGMNRTAGGTPVNLALGDVDADGDLDIVTVNGTASCSVFLNTGAGVFDSGATINLGGTARDVALGDLNQDGYLDFVAVGANLLAVGLNDGNGTFSSVTNTVAQNYPYSVELGDLDADGDLDMAVLLRSIGQVLIRFNNGSGSFTNGNAYSVASGASGLDLGDLDHDGDLDFITANDNGGNAGTATNNPGTASVRFNNGAGTFSGGNDFDSGNNTSDVALGDLDGDGDLDFVTANATVNGGVVTQWNVTGLLPSITSFTPTSGPIGTLVTVTGTDLAAARSVNLFLSTQRSPGTIVSNTATSLTFVVGAGTKVGAIQIATAGGIATSSDYFTITSSVVVNTITPVSGPVGSSLAITGSGMSNVTNVQFGDVPASFTINSPSTIAVTVPRVASSQPIRLTSPTGQTLSSAFTVIRPNTSLLYALQSANFGGINATANSAPAIVDIDRDDRLDVLVGKADGTIDHYEQNTINGSGFTRIGSLTDGSAAITVGTNAVPAVTDIDGDGLLDLLLGSGSGLVYHYEQSTIGGHVFTLLNANFGDINTTANSVPTLTDLNMDGRLDVLVGKADGTIGHFRQSDLNSNNFTRITSSFNSINVGANSTPLVIDLDGDGLLDLLVGNNQGNVYHYKQITAGSTSFSQVTTNFNSLAQGGNARPVVTDLDGDGNLDLVVGRADGTISQYEQQVSGPIITGFSANMGEVCAGGLVTFTATVGNYSDSYTWRLLTKDIILQGTSSNGNFSFSVNPTSSGVQTCTLVVISGDQSVSATTNLIVNPRPVATLVSSGTLTCTITSVTLTAASGASSYTFTNSAGQQLAGSGNTRTVTTPGNYMVTLLGSNGCTNIATTSVSSNTVLNLATGASLPQANVGVVVSLTASGAIAYQWNAPSTALLTTPATGSAVSVSLTTAGVQTFTVVGTSGACSQRALVSVTALAGPDLSAIINLPDGSFPAGGRKGLLMQVQEVNGAISTGNIVITITVPTGYSVSFDNTLTSFTVSGLTPNPVVPVDNTRWHQSNRASGQQLSVSINSGQSVGINSTMNLGFSVSRTTANSGSVSSITVNIADDSSGGTYDVNRLNNVYARIINGL